MDVVDLLSPEELQNVIDRTEKYGANFKWDYSAESTGKKIVYQINCSYYSAVGEDDNAYLLSRALQFFAPGIPQVYYMGLLAGENDYELMKRTNYDRNISRHDYTMEEIRELVKKPVVQKLRRLMQFRNDYPVFDGEMTVHDTADNIIRISWQEGTLKATLTARLEEKSFDITYLDRENRERTLILEEDFMWNE